MRETPNTNDKVIFAVSFLTVLVALSGYKDYLDNIKVSIFSYSFSIFDLLISMSVILFCSVYFSAVDNLRLGSIKLAQSKLLEKCSLIADFLYLIAIVVLPSTFIVSYLISCFFYGTIHIFSSFSHINPNFDLLSQLSTIISLTSVVLTLISTYLSYKVSKDEEVEKTFKNILEDETELKKYKDFYKKLDKRLLQRIEKDLFKYEGNIPKNRDEDTQKMYEEEIRKYKEDILKKYKERETGKV